MIRAPRNGPRAAQALLAGGLCRRRARNRLFAFHVHTITSSAPGSTSSDSASSVSTSPSTTTSTGFFKLKFDSRRRPPRSQWMPDMLAGEESRQTPHQAHTADRSPVNIFDRAAIDRGLRRDHHFTASILAIAKGNEKAAPVVALAVRSQRKRAAAQPRQETRTPTRYPGSPRNFSCRFVKVATSAANPIFSVLM